MDVATEPIQPDTPLYNSRIISSFLRFIERYCDEVDVAELLSYAQMARYQVEDDNHWFNQEQVDLFHTKLVNLTNNQNIAREAGRYAVSTDSLGLVKSYALGLVNPAKACELIRKAVIKITKSCVWESTRIGPTKIEITVTPKPGTQERFYQCENRMGYIEAIFALFKHRLPKIEHTECAFKGGKCCRYVITWHAFQSDIWAKIRNCVALALAAVCFSLAYFSSYEVWTIASVLSLLGVSGLSYKIWHMEKTELLAAVENLTKSTDALFEKLDQSDKNASLIHDVGLTLTKQRFIDGILKDVAKILEQRLDYKRGMIFLADKEAQILRFRAGFGYNEDQVTSLQKASFKLRPDSKGILVVCFQERRPFLINDIDNIKDNLSHHSLEFAKEMKVKSFICCPIVCVDDTLGVLAFDNMNTKRRLLQSDIDLLMALSPEIGISIQNAMVTDTKERQFDSILRVLASSIDARDPLTSGHSERVTRLALGIAEELGLSETSCEIIRVAALLHDYGKIGIGDNILKKPGALSAEEYQEIKTHATKTEEILNKIEFEGGFKEVPAIAASHHEGWNGTGYPKGLKGEEIPLGARILAVADVFEAVTSVRHYRSPMPLEEALNIIVSDRGKKFDPAVVDAFMKYYAEKGRATDFVEEEQLMSQPLSASTVDSPVIPLSEIGALSRGLRPRTLISGV